jgi:osmotically-inducible protein OsmY
LLDDPEVKGLRINVTTVRGVVILEGRVPSDYAREKAIRIARETGSVLEVDDRLTVAE